MALATAVRANTPQTPTTAGMNGGKDAGVNNSHPTYITSELARKADHSYHMLADCIDSKGDRAQFDLLLVNYGETAITNAIAKAGRGDGWTVLTWKIADTVF